MNTHDKINRLIDKLEAIPAMDFAARAKGFHDLRAAIEAYAKRIAELESQLEAIGAGGVTHGQRLIEADRQRWEAPAAEGWPEPLSEFSEGQWWVKELDALKDLPGASNDQKRAVAVVHHLLASVDRQRRGEPVAWYSKQYGVVWMAVKPGNLVAGTQWFIRGRQEPIAEVASPVSIQWHIATSELEHGTVFYSAPQPAEPSGPAKDAVEEDNRRAADQACNVLALRLGYVWNGEDWIEHKPSEPIPSNSIELGETVEPLKVPSAEEISDVIREITGCPDIKNGDESLVVKLSFLLASYGHMYRNPESIDTSDERVQKTGGFVHDGQTDSGDAVQQAIKTMEYAIQYHNTMLMSDPPQSAWKFHGMDGKLKDAIQALEDTIEAYQRQQWQPIETAPKDGTDIMLTDGEYVTVGHWYHEEPSIKEHRDLEGRWIGQDESDGYEGWLDWIGGIPATHWAALPAPPEKANA